MEKFVSKHITALDGLRGIAIIMVVGFHYIATISPPASKFLPIAKIAMFGWTGVDLFFVLSGFLVGGKLLDHKSSTNYFKVFYLRRAFRILPLYISWILLYILIVTIEPSVQAGNLAWTFEKPFPMVSYFTFTQNIFFVLERRTGPQWMGPTWSSAVEEQFYFLLPIVIRFLPYRHLIKLCCLCVIMAPSLRLLLLNFDPKHWILPASYFLLTPRLDSFMIGVMCACVVRNDFLWRLCCENYKLIHTILIGLLFNILAFIATDCSPASLTTSVFGMTTIALFYGFLILVSVTHPHSLMSRVIGSKLLCFFGKISYGMYIFHQSVLGIVHATFRSQMPVLNNNSDLVACLLAFAISILLAYGSWILFERHFVHFGRSVSYKY
jgi:peptidoglycan/LPS O-acetylase OafA/YrhL